MEGSPRHLLGAKSPKQIHTVAQTAVGNGEWDAAVPVHSPALGVLLKARKTKANTLCFQEVILMVLDLVLQSELLDLYALYQYKGIPVGISGVAPAFFNLFFMNVIFRQNRKIIVLDTVLCL